MRKIVIALAALAVTGAAQATSLMSADWAAQACKYWNTNSTLTDELGKSWINNNANRGYKIVHMYRSDCGPGYQAELKLVPKDGKAICDYGGAVQHTNLDLKADYVMYASTQRWHEMGAGEYGPMKAMMFNRLKFDGPSVEAMGVMGPFGQFLLLPGKIPGDDSCPK
jgi:putative sterol carrier protein